MFQGPDKHLEQEKSQQRKLLKNGFDLLNARIISRDTDILDGIFIYSQNILEAVDQSGITFADCTHAVKVSKYGEVIGKRKKSAGKQESN